MKLAQFIEMKDGVNAELQSIQKRLEGINEMIEANLFSNENLEGVFSHEGSTYCSSLGFNLDKIGGLLELDE